MENIYFEKGKDGPIGRIGSKISFPKGKTVNVGEVWECETLEKDKCFLVFPKTLLIKNAVIQERGTVHFSYNPIEISRVDQDKINGYRSVYFVAYEKDAKPDYSKDSRWQKDHVFEWNGVEGFKACKICKQHESFHEIKG